MSGPSHPEREALRGVYQRLDAMHRWRGWHWWPDADPFEVIVGAILVQNTAWSNVERALEFLNASGALSPDAMAAIAPEDLEQLVRPSGQYRQKARKLRAFLALLERYSPPGEPLASGLGKLLALPQSELRAVLLATFGIGPETADCIALYAARQPVFIVDAYLIRLFSRLGLGPVGSTNYDVWQRWVTDALDQPDRDAWAIFRAEIVLHCKYLCRKLRPKCGECLLRPQCPYGQAQP